MSNEQFVIAKVTAVKTGLLRRSERYVICSVGQMSKGSITFTLVPEIWKENADPHEGNFVALSEIREARGGTRALCARSASTEERHQFLAAQEEASRKETPTNSQRILVRKWGGLFKPEDAGVWHDWLHSQHIWYDSLRNLYADKGISESFRARALFIVLSPDLSICPIEWVGSPYKDGSFAHCGQSDSAGIHA